MTCQCGRQASIDFDDWKQPLAGHECECGFQIPGYVLDMTRDKAREEVEAKLRQKAMAS